jgi:hypothetical protein
VRPYNQGSDFPTLLALFVAVGFPLLLLSLVFDVFPRDRLDKLVAELRPPWLNAEARPSPSPLPAAIASPTPVVLTSADWDIPGGHFFTQTNGRPPRTNSTGYPVTNAGGIAFWDEFRRLGGIPAAGYPLSNRFSWRGFTVQVFQRVVFQSPEKGGEVSILNLMDELSAAGKDDFLKNERFTPLPLSPEFDEGKSPGDIPAARLALLTDDPEIEKFYRSTSDAVRLYGLPTSRVTDMGDYLVAIRCQRAVLQHWKKDTDWAKAGDVTLANAGQIAVELGLFPTEGLQPTFQAPPQVSAIQAGPAASPTPVPTR